MAVSCSALGASRMSSSCTCRIRRLSSPSRSRRSRTRTMAILMMSAAVPWMGVFIATRSPNERMLKLRLCSSGSARRRPNSVVT